MMVAQHCATELFLEGEPKRKKEELQNVHIVVFFLEICWWGKALDEEILENEIKSPVAKEQQKLQPALPLFVSLET